MENHSALRIGLVGCGWQGNILAQAIARTQSLCVAACADPDEAAASRAAALGQNVSTHTSIEALLAECEVDAVLVATPHHLLVPITLTALRAGKHVLAEKPIALNEHGAAEIEATAAQAGVCFMAGYSFRFSIARYVHDLVTEGAVGEIVAVTGSIGHGPRDSGWMAYPETGGGPLLYVGSHLVDMILWFLGDKPVSIYAEQRRRSDTGADDTSAAQIRFARGAVAQCMVTQSAATFSFDIHIQGRSGEIALRGRNFLQYEIEVSSTALPTYKEPTVIRPGIQRDAITMMFVPELEEFANAIRENRLPSITASDGRSVLRVLDAIVQSGQSGRLVTFDQ